MSLSSLISVVRIPKVVIWFRFNHILWSYSLCCTYVIIDIITVFHFHTPDQDSEICRIKYVQINKTTCLYIIENKNYWGDKRKICAIIFLTVPFYPLRSIPILQRLYTLLTPFANKWQSELCQCLWPNHCVPLTLGSQVNIRSRHVSFDIKVISVDSMGINPWEKCMLWWSNQARRHTIQLSVMAFVT